jgi:hypothetical protein
MKRNVLAIASVLFITTTFACAVLAAGPTEKTASFDAAKEQASLGNEWAKWFAADMRLHAVDGAPFPVFSVCTLAGKTNGWVFRTDRVPPVVIGKRGEIGVLTAIGTDGLIKGVHVLESHENPHWFDRLDAAFYQKFTGKTAGTNSMDKIDTVTGATLSSKAVIGDVFQSSQSVLELPVVKAVLQRAP